MTRVAAAVVTHNGLPWVPECIDSILGQSHSADVVIVVDDHSTDGTPELLQERYGAHIVLMPADPAVQALSRHARIAANFTKAVEGAVSLGAELVALGDQDDRWLGDRLERQIAGMEGLAMMASDGWLVDSTGNRSGATLRTAFPVAPEFESLTPAEQLGLALRRSVATGGASMIRPGAFHTLQVPAGWLHDRWWSLAAIALGRFAIDRNCAIEYRITEDQVVGLGQGSQRGGPTARLLHHLARGSTLGRLRALRSLDSWPGVDCDVQQNLRWPNLIRIGLRS